MFLKLLLLAVALNSFGHLELIYTNAEECEPNCYNCGDDSVPKPQYKHFTTKSAYQFIKGYEEDIYKIAACETVKIWSLSRDGKRFPNEEELVELRNLKTLRDTIIENFDAHTTESSIRSVRADEEFLCDKDLELLNGWDLDEFEHTSAEEHSINEDNELSELGSHYKSAFGKLLGDVYSPDKFLFRHTNDTRAEANFRAFSNGLFQNREPIELVPIVEPDMLLKSYEYCDEWNDNFKEQDKPDSESSKFEKSDTFQEMIVNASRRLRIEPSLIKIQNIWNMCRYDKAWNANSPSPWCSALTADHINILEYRDDINYYYKTGYGADINSRVACSTIANMLTHLETDTTASPKLIAYFANELTLQLFLTALGVAKDTTSLKSNNFMQMSYRKYRTSQISPFASNVAVVKYHCENDTEAPYRVQFFLNQKPLHFRWCGELCYLNDVVNAYRSYKNANCNTYYCSGAAKFVVGVFALVCNLILIYSF